MSILAQGFQVTIFAMAVVFLVLIVLMFIIKVQTSILGKDTKNKVQDVKKIESKKEVLKEISKPKTSNEAEIVAVIMAAISAHGEMEGIQFNIKSIKRVSGNESSWRKAGIN